MKKLYTFLVIALIGFVGNGQIITFTSLNFKNKVLAANTTNQIAKDLSGNFFKVDSNNDGQVQVSEAQQVSYLNISNSTIFYMEGLQHFTNLVTLYCQSNSSNTNVLDVSMMPNLEYLTCNNSNLSTLNINGLTHLKELLCFSNGLTSLNVSAATNLQLLRCYGTAITTLNLTGLSNLLEVYCNNSANLASINFTGCTSLTKIKADYCGLTNGLNFNGLNNLANLELSQNPFTVLNASNLPSLTFLQAAAGQLVSLDVSNCSALVDLWCNNNQLTSLNMQNCTSLDDVNMRFNQLTSVDLSSCINMSTLDCRNNLLTTIDASNCSSLMSLYCFNNNLVTMFLKNGVYTTLGVTGNPNLSYICCDDDASLGATPGYGEIYTLEMHLAEWGIPNCVVNPYCSFTIGGPHYVVNGSTVFDVNGDGCGTGDVIIPSQRYNIANGSYTGSVTANGSGNCTMYSPAGNFSITPTFEIPAYFTASPPNVIIPFPATASPNNQNFCVTANGNHNDLEVLIVPIIPARPGFNATYEIIYRNKGTTVQNGTVTLSYDDTVSNLIAAQPATASQSSNLLNWNFSSLIPFETRRIRVTLHINTPTDIPSVAAGDILTYTATIAGATDETPADNTFTFNMIVVGSFDPNDKTCLQGTLVEPTTAGQYVDYVIRFENTGTANAENIVVKDMIDTTKFTVSSLVPLGGSAPFETKVTGTNQIEFIFENINLPFDEANNDGYVVFKIKTKPTLIAGNTFSNSASIYFDYNAPIVTAAYTTTLQSLGIADFDFDHAFILSPVPAKDTLHITTKQDITLSSVNIYNTLGQLIQVNTNPAETIDVSELETGSYFIRILSDKGSATGKFIKE